MLIQQVANGLLTGTVYALLAVGLTLVYSTTRVVNFAHGEMFALGAFFGLAAQQRMNLPFPIAAALACCAVFALGAGFASLVLSRLRSPLERSVATIAASLGIRDGLQIAFGSDSLSYAPVYPTGRCEVLGISLAFSSLWIAGTTIVLLAGMRLFINRTRYGIWMRATAQDETLAATAGINTLRMQALGFGLGCALAAAAGVIFGPVWQVQYAVGSVICLKAFVAATIGGFGNISGALAGGLLLGVAEAMVAAYGSSTWKDAWIFAGFLALLALLPRGMLSRGPARAG